MADDLVFLMGKFPAELPGDLCYATTNHMWSRPLTPTPLPPGEREGPAALAVGG